MEQQTGPDIEPHDDKVRHTSTDRVGHGATDRASLEAQNHKKG